MATNEALKLMGQDIVAQLQAEAKALGAALTSEIEGLAAYAAGRADHLSFAIGEPGFEDALRAERDALALRASLGAVARADEIDARILAVTQGSLALAARGLRLLAGVPPVA